MSKATWAAALLLALPSVPAAAQVGHDPAQSPYRPIFIRSSIMATGAVLSGSGGLLDLGPSSGVLVGLRYEMRLSGPTDASLSLSWGRLERMVADPDAPADSQVTGPVRQSVVLAEAGLTILLTGDKTWNRLAPYLGGSLGLAIGGGVPADSSGFKFSTKFASGPHVGMRLYVSERLTVRTEGRLLFWQLKYPSRFFAAPARAPDDPPLLDLASDPDSEWTSHPMLLFAVGYAFRL